MSKSGEDKVKVREKDNKWYQNDTRMILKTHKMTPENIPMTLKITLNDTKMT